MEQLNMELIFLSEAALRRKPPPPPAKTLKCQNALYNRIHPADYPGAK